MPNIKQNPPSGGFHLWLADQDYSRYALALRAAAVPAAFLLAALVSRT